MSWYGRMLDSLFEIDLCDIEWCSCALVKQTASEFYFLLEVELNGILMREISIRPEYSTDLEISDVHSMD